MPALLGASCTYLLVRKIGREKSRALDVVSIGIGLSLGYVAVASMIWALDQANATVFSWRNLISLLLLALVSVISAVYYHFRVGKHSDPFNGLAEARWTLGFTIGCLVLFAFSLFQVIQSPVSSWDAIDWWVASADRFITVDTQLLPRFIWNEFNFLAWDPLPYYDWASQEPVAFGAPYPYDHYHPITVPLIAAFSAIWAYEFNVIRLNMLPWIYCWMSIIVTIYGLTRVFEVNQIAALLSICLISSVPLIENHLGLVGYADIWLVAVALTSLSLISIGRLKADLGLIIIGLMAGLVCILIKNSGFIFFLTIILSTVLSWLTQLRAKIVAAGLVISFSATLISIYIGIDFEFAGTRWAIVINDNISIHLAGRNFVAEVSSLSQVAQNLYRALLVNASYSTFGIISILMSFFWMQNVLRKNDPRRFAGASIFFYCSALLFLFLLVSQLIWPLALEVANVNSDTANSRYHIPVYIFILVFGALTLFQRSEKYFE